jgi:hypothetical protein
MHRVRSLLIPIALGLLIACGGGGHSSSQAIGQFVAAEDGGFAAERGSFRGAANGLKYYETTLQLPGASSCAVYTTPSGAHAFGTCDFLASGPDEARRIYDDWKQKTIAALPGWKTAELKRSPEGHLATFQAVDGNKHAVYLYVAADAGTYRVAETFGTTDAFASH